VPIAIQNARDLAEAASSGRLLATLFPTIDQWLPQLIASVAWSARLSAHFALLYHCDPSVVAPLDQDAFLAECEQCREQILQYLHTAPSTKAERDALKSHLTVMIFHVQSKRTFGNSLRPNMLLYLLDTEQDPDYRTKIRHEMTHWLWGALYSEAPALLNEGVAVVAETLSAPDKTEADLFQNLRPIDDVPSLEQLAGNGAFFGAGTGYYRMAGTFVYFLSQRGGWERVAEVFRRTDYDDPAFGSKFAQVYGFSLREADAEWRSLVRSRMG